MADDEHKLEIRIAVLEVQQSARDSRIEKLEGTLVWVVRTVFVIVIGAVLAGVGISK